MNNLLRENCTRRAVGIRMQLLTFPYVGTGIQDKFRKKSHLQKYVMTNCDNLFNHFACKDEDEPMPKCYGGETIQQRPRVRYIYILV